MCHCKFAAVCLSFSGICKGAKPSRFYSDDFALWIIISLSTYTFTFQAIQWKDGNVSNSYLGKLNYIERNNYRNWWISCSFCEFWARMEWWLSPNFSVKKKWVQKTAIQSNPINPSIFFEIEFNLFKLCASTYSNTSWIYPPVIPTATKHVSSVTQMLQMNDN